jgi:hypothetical protein
VQLRNRAEQGSLCRSTHKNTKISKMKKLSFTLASISVLLLSGCMVVPLDTAPESSFCPPGQAKKGNCRAQEEQGFCPPGQAKKGRC